MARDAPAGIVEQKLLLQVLEQGILLEEVKDWLDDAFHVLFRFLHGRPCLTLCWFLSMDNGFATL